MKTINFKVEDFEGPLDLLLALIAKNKMNIYEINIVKLIEHYLEVVANADEYAPELASEFIDMAARLVQMKSYFLLPKSEEAERLKQELTGLLIEYSLCKTIAQKLRVMANSVHTFVREPAEIEIDTQYKHRHETFELVMAYGDLQGRSKRRQSPTQERFEPIVQAPIVSVTSRIIVVLRSLIMGKAKKLGELFTKGTSRSATVATFLAVLELIRAGRLEIDDSESLKMCKTKNRNKTQKVDVV